MNVNPDAFTILCFGDSNTFGQPPRMRGRWPSDVRWTGRLQQILGSAYAIIEEGLGGRTTDLDDPDRDDRNGRRYFQPCLRSHSPLDLVMIMLGNNDLKTKFGRDVDEVAAALEGYLDNIERTAWNRDGAVPAALLVSPIHIDADQPGFASYSSEYSVESACKSRELGTAIRRVAEKRSALFADAAAVARSGDDGAHLSRESHESLALHLAETVMAHF